MTEAEKLAEKIVWALKHQRKRYKRLASTSDQNAHDWAVAARSADGLIRLARAVIATWKEEHDRTAS